MKKTKKIRPLGQIWLEMEPLIIEMFEDHDIQHGDFLGQTYCYLLSHLPGYREEYLDGSHPVMYYGSKEYALKKSTIKKKRRKKNG